MHEPELHLGEDILVPDVAGWRRERLPRIPETWDAVIAPDWVCETLADSTRDLDLNGKRPIYAREGFPHLWLVDPSLLRHVWPLGWSHIVLTGDYDWNSGAAQRTNVRPLNLYPAKIRA